MKKTNKLTLYSILTGTFPCPKFKINKEIRENVRQAEVIEFINFISFEDEPAALLERKENSRTIYCLVDTENSEVINVFDKDKRYPIIKTGSDDRITNDYDAQELLNRELVLSRDIVYVNWNNINQNTYRQIKQNYNDCKKKQLIKK